MMRAKTLSARVILFMTGMVLLFSFLIIRVIDLQVVRGRSYLVRAESNRFSSLRVSAPRGVILDRYKDPLVWNVQKYFQIQNPNSLYTQRVGVTRDQALQILSSTQSATVVSDTERMYRYPQSLAHVLGYVGPVTVDDLRKDDSLAVGKQIGKSGLEAVYEKQLRGQDGNETYEVNAVGMKQRLVNRTEPVTGNDIETSLDPYLTEFAAQALGDQRGSIIITDAQTGKILTMTSKPTFDPNVMTQSFVEKDKEAQRKEQIQNFFQDPEKLFFDRAISGAYPPGSIFKIATSLAGLENGAVTESTQVVDVGKIQVGVSEFGNWYFRQYGKVEGALSIIKAIARSNDIFFYKTAEWTGPEKIAAMAREIGLGAKTGIDLPAETAGLIPDPEWKRRTRQEKWFLGDTYHMGIGQGDILTSPIQVAQMTQTMANNGSLCSVSLNASTPPSCRLVNIKQSDLNLVLRGMIGACSKGGTAYPFFPYNTAKIGEINVENDATDPQHLLDQGAIGCKTGTAEFGAADAKGNRKTHAWFTSIIGMPDQWGTSSLGDELHHKWIQKVREHGFPKRIIITVMIESNDLNPFMEGSKDGGTLTKKIVDWLEQ